jgi:hypothetical protein
MNTYSSGNYCHGGFRIVPSTKILDITGWWCFAFKETRNLGYPSFESGDDMDYYSE